MVEPAVAACGLPVAKCRACGLGFSGGTLDKVNLSPDFAQTLPEMNLLSNWKSLGLVLTGQSSDLAPADGKLYALRDVHWNRAIHTADCFLVMSRRSPSGPRGYIGCKVGLGAFMHTLAEAKQLAELMVSIGKMSGRRVVALLSDMNQPLGKAVGNALELREAIDTLHNQGPADFTRHCINVGAYMLYEGQKASSLDVGRELIKRSLEKGHAWVQFRSLVIAQGGDVNYIDQPERLPGAVYVENILAPSEGWLEQVNACKIGETAVLLGAGRAQKSDLIDPGVGITVHVKVGQHIERGQTLFTVHANKVELAAQAREALLEAFIISEQPVEPLPLFYGVIS